MPISSFSAPSAIAKPGVVANAAARPASPYDGQVVYQQDTDALLIWNGSAWYPPNNVPWGIVGKAEKTSNTSLNTGQADISGMSVTWTAVSSRLYKLSVTGIGKTTASGNHYISIYIVDSSNNAKQFIRSGATTTDLQFPLSGFLYETGLSGSITRKLRAETGSGTADILSGATYPLQFIVEDIGPA